MTNSQKTFCVKLGGIARELALESPETASLLYAAIIAIKMNRMPELTRLLKEFSKSLVDAGSTKKIEQERNEMTTLLIKKEESLRVS